MWGGDARGARVISDLDFDAPGDAQEPLQVDALRAVALQPQGRLQRGGGRLVVVRVLWTQGGDGVEGLDGGEIGLGRDDRAEQTRLGHGAGWGRGKRPRPTCAAAAAAAPPPPCAVDGYAGRAVRPPVGRSVCPPVEYGVNGVPIVLTDPPAAAAAPAAWPPCAADDDQYSPNGAVVGGRPAVLSRTGTTIGTTLDMSVFRPRLPCVRAAARVVSTRRA